MVLNLKLHHCCAYLKKINSWDRNGITTIRNSMELMKGSMGVSKTGDRYNY